MEGPQKFIDWLLEMGYLEHISMWKHLSILRDKEE